MQRRIEFEIGLIFFVRRFPDPSHSYVYIFFTHWYLYIYICIVYHIYGIKQSYPRDFQGSPAQYSPLDLARFPSRALVTRRYGSEIKVKVNFLLPSRKSVGEKTKTNDIVVATSFDKNIVSMNSVMGRRKNVPKNVGACFCKELTSRSVVTIVINLCSS